MQKISELYQTCGAAAFGFTLQEFCDLLTDAVKRSLGEGSSLHEQAQFIKTLHLHELVLARACARGHAGAWERFVSSYREKLYAAALSIARQEWAARELADSLYADLFGTRLRSDGRRCSKFESYSGRGSLEGWLRTVLAQEHVNRMRDQRRLVPFEEDLDAGAEASCSRETQTCTGHLEKATDAALAALSGEERFLLAAYYLDGRTLAEVARILHVHESTIARRLRKITASVRRRIIASLCAAGVSKRAADEALEADVRDLGVDVRSRLAQERQA